MSEKMHQIYAFICLYHCECTSFPLQDLQCVVLGAAEAVLLSTRHILCCSNGDFLPPCCCGLNLGSGSGLGEPSVMQNSHRGSSLASQVQCCCSSLQKPNLIWPLLCLTLLVKLTVVNCICSLVFEYTTITTLHCTGNTVYFFNIRQTVLCFKTDTSSCSL